MSSNWAYLVIPREIHDDTRLDWAEIILFAHIHSFTSQGLECWVSIDTFAQRLRKSDRMVSIYLKKLKNLGLIRVISTDGRRRKLVSTLEIVINKTPKPISGQTRNTLHGRHETHCMADMKPIAGQTRNPLRTNNKENSTTNNTIDKGTKAKPISLNEVVEYFKTINAEQCSNEFYDHYTANGWIQGQNKKIKDWRAAANNWKRRQHKFKQHGNNKTQGFNAGNYDVERLKTYINTGKNDGS